MRYHHYKRAVNKGAPLLKSLDGLALEDLRKIKRAHAAKMRSLGLYQEQQLASEAREASTRTKSELWDRIHLRPAQAEVHRLTSSLASHEIGFFKRALVPCVSFRGKSYELRFANMLISQLVAAEKALELTLQRRPPEFITERTRKLAGPKLFSTLSINGVNMRVDFNLLDLPRIDALIDAHLSKLSQAKEKQRELEARAASNEQEKRKQAQLLRRSLLKQRNDVSECPYCLGSLMEENAHLDHIYPVSKGGHSSAKNLVFVCSTCNLAKKNRTLRNFILSCELDEKAIYERLEKLKKDF